MSVIYPSGDTKLAAQPFHIVLDNCNNNDNDGGKHSSQWWHKVGGAGPGDGVRLGGKCMEVEEKVVKKLNEIQSLRGSVW